MDFRGKGVRQGVDAGDTHAVQTAGDLVTVLVELTAGMQHGEHDFQSAAMLLLVHTRRDTTAVILDTDGVVFQNFHIHVRAIAGHGLVDTVIDNLIHQVVQAAFADIADIHGRALAHSLKAFQNLNTTGRILLLGRFHLLVFYHFSI